MATVLMLDDQPVHRDLMITLLSSDAMVPMAAFLGVHHVVVKPAEPLSLLAAAERALAEAPACPAGGCPARGTRTTCGC